MNFKTDKLNKKLISSLRDHEVAIESLNKPENLKKVFESLKILLKVLKNGGTIFWCGHGGSAADCQHLSAELIGRFKINRRPYKSISLTTDTSAITAISNDYGYNHVFSRQLEGLGTKKDLLFALSTSGNSQNIVNAMISAKKKKMKIIALLGNKGGKCKKYSNINIIIDSKETARIQEAHTLIGHILCEMVEHLIRSRKL